MNRRAFLRILPAAPIAAPAAALQMGQECPPREVTLGLLPSPPGLPPMPLVLDLSKLEEKLLQRMFDTMRHRRGGEYRR